MNGTVTVSIVHLLVFAEYFHVTPDYLLGYDEANQDPLRDRIGDDLYYLLKGCRGKTLELVEEIVLVTIDIYRRYTEKSCR